MRISIPLAAYWTKADGVIHTLDFQPVITDATYKKHSSTKPPLKKFLANNVINNSADKLKRRRDKLMDDYEKQLQVWNQNMQEYIEKLELLDYKLAQKTHNLSHYNICREGIDWFQDYSITKTCPPDDDDDDNESIVSDDCSSLPHSDGDDGDDGDGGDDDELMQAEDEAHAEESEEEPNNPNEESFESKEDGVDEPFGSLDDFDNEEEEEEEDEDEELIRLQRNLQKQLATNAARLRKKKRKRRSDDDSSPPRKHVNNPEEIRGAEMNENIQRKRDYTLATLHKPYLSK